MEKVEDLKLPTAVISRIIKSALPDQCAVSRDARVAMSRAASVFILHSSNFAGEAAAASGRKTVAAADVLKAVAELGCEDLVPQVESALESWREQQKSKKEKQKKEKHAADKENDNNEGGEEHAEHGEEHAAAEHDEQVAGNDSDQDRE